MKTSSRFAIALHMMLCMDTFSAEQKVTSEFIAASVCVNPVIIRKMLGQLKDAGIVEVARGTGGARIKKEGKDITLLDVFYAVEPKEQSFFGFHENPNPACPVGKNVHSVLDGYLMDAQNAMEKTLEKTTFFDVKEKLGGYLRADKE